MLSRLFIVSVLAGNLSLSAAGTERKLAVDFPQSKVEVAVRATMDSFVGRLVRYEPAITIGDDGRVVAARISFHFRDVETGKDGRDKSMHSWQQTETFPDGEFVLSSLESGAGGAYTAFGRLTFHGVNRDLRFPVLITRDGERYAIDGDAAVDTRVFGLPIIRMFKVLKVDPLVHVRFHLQGVVDTTGRGTK